MGATVVREAGPWSRTVLALLEHFNHVGFDGAPRVVGSGFDADGRETLTFLPGTSPHPRAWSDTAVHRLGEVLRGAHQAAASFEPSTPACWQPWFGRDLPGEHPVIGHCDVGPWNWVATEDGLPYALVDWEFAGPTDAMWELAAAAWLNAQLHDIDVAELHELPDARHRAQQARLIFDGYGLEREQRIGMVDRMIDFAVHEAAAEARSHNVAAATPDGDDSGGYPLLWAIAWRTRSASWMLRNRALLDKIITG